MFESQVSHAYVRACTRGRESHLVHMMERNNEVHRHTLTKITQLDTDMLRWTETLAASPHSSIPPCTLQETGRRYPSDSEDDDTTVFIKDPTTSGRIYLQDATSVIYRFASSMVSQNIGMTPGERLFKFDHERKEFGAPRTYICTVLLPGTPANGVSGSPSTSRAHARRSACYRACEEFLMAGILDYRLFPLRFDPLDDIQLAESLSSQNFLDKKTSGTRLYPRKQPEFWTNTESASLTLLYPTIILTNDPEGSSQPRTPFLIITRESLPDLASFNLFCSTVPTRIDFRRGAAFWVDANRLHDLHLYTVRLSRVVSNKPYACDMAKMVCFFAPLTRKYMSAMPNVTLPSVVEFIPWDLVALAGRDYAIPLMTGSFEELQHDVEDAVIQDRWVEFTRRYDAVRMRPDLTPLSKPLDSPVRHLYFVV
jgi:endoribonuclease Dicer